MLMELSVMALILRSRLGGCTRKCYSWFRLRMDERLRVHCFWLSIKP